MLQRLAGAPSSRVLELGGGRSVLVREWPGAGRPLVLLHGLMSASASWQAVAEAIGRACLAIDLPGFGASTLPRRACLEVYADTVVCALRRLGVEPDGLLGHSFGGAVATAVAERMADSIDRLILCAPAGFGRLPLAEVACLPVLRSLALSLAPRVERRHPSLVGHGSAGARRSPHGIRLRSWTEATALRPGLRAGVQALTAAGRSPQAFHRRRVRYSGEVVAIWGDRDGVVPAAHAAALQSSLPQAVICLWPGMGHCPHRERPRELAALLGAGRLSGAGLELTRTHSSRGLRRWSTRANGDQLALAHRALDCEPAAQVASVDGWAASACRSARREATSLC